MSQRRHYSKAPIREAVIELRANLIDGMTIDRIREIEPSIRDRYPIRKSIFAGHLQVDFGESPTAEASHQEIGYRFADQDERQVLQIRLNGFAFSVLAPYDRWETFRDEAKDLWEAYRHICQPGAVTRVAVRYINRLDIPTQFGDLRDYLVVRPEGFAALPTGQLLGFFMQLQVPQYDLDCMLILNQTFVPPTSPDQISVILDFDLFREQTWRAEDEAIWEFLEQLHARKNEIFEASITDRIRELIK